MLVDTYDLARALKAQFGVRGGGSFDLGETILPVMQIGDMESSAAPLGIPWAITLAPAAGAGTRSYVAAMALPGQYVIRVDRVKQVSGGATGSSILVGRGAPTLVGADTRSVILDSSRWGPSVAGIGGTAGLTHIRSGADTIANITGRALVFHTMLGNGQEWLGRAWLSPPPVGTPDLDTFLAAVGNSDNVTYEFALQGMAFGTR